MAILKRNKKPKKQKGINYARTEAQKKRESWDPLDDLALGFEATKIDAQPIEYPDGGGKI